MGDEAHQLPGSEPAEATVEDEVRSARADPSAAAPSAPAPKVPTMSAQQAVEDDVVRVIGPGTQL